MAQSRHGYRLLAAIDPLSRFDAAVNESDHPLIECRGGPWDGRRIVDRGPQFTVSSMIGSDGTLQQQRRKMGYYERHAESYQWHPVANLTCTLAWLKARPQRGTDFMFGLPCDS